MKTRRLLTTAMAVLLSLPALAPQPRAAVVPDGEIPALLISDLLDAIPTGTASVCSWTSGPETAHLEAKVLEVLDAIVAARFDDFLFETMDVLGAPAEVVTELEAIRNLFTSVGGVVPWDALLGRQLVYAETPAKPFLPGVDVPSMILITQPHADRLEQIERGLSAVLGSFAARMAGPIRYDIERQPELSTTIYKLILRTEQDETAMLSVAVIDDTILFGLGQEYFESTLQLLRGAERPSLTDTNRWRTAFGDLPASSSGRSYLDVPKMVSGLDDLAALIAETSYNGGFWQAMLNETFQLADAVDTVATTIDCRGDKLVTASLTRLNRDTPSLVRSGLSQAASGQLLEYVPHDVVAFSSRGTIDLDPAYQWTREKLAQDWSAGEDLLWVAELAQATLDLWIDRDLLSWIGSEHVSMTVPGDIGAATETVLITRLADKAGARRCINRAEGVLKVLLPRVVGGIQGLLAENQVPFKFDVAIVPAEGGYPGLKQLQLTLGNFPIPSLTYGFMGDLFVATTSQGALERSFAAAVGEEDGLWSHDLLAEHMGRDDLCSVSLVPVGRQMAETVAGINSTHAMVRGILGPAVAEDPTMTAALGQLRTLVDRVTDIMLKVDFLGDAVTVSEVRDGGLSRYELTTQALLGFPSRSLTSPITQR
ncbi:MAG: hypothetical protein ACI9EF_000444 [Pseudohongiellaceae bacterium]|jgi:hypothetical protein